MTLAPFLLDQARAHRGVLSRSNSIASASDLEAETAAQEEAITDLEAAALVDAAAAEALRERLANADTELTAMTLNLERQRQEIHSRLSRVRGLPCP